MSERFTHMFSSKSFIVLALIFRSLIHFELVLKSRSMNSPTSFLFLKIVLAVLGPLSFCVNFINVYKDLAGILTGSILNLHVWSGEYYPPNNTKSSHPLTGKCLSIYFSRFSFLSVMFRHFQCISLILFC